MHARFLIVGAGFSGCVLAHEIARKLDCTVSIIDERSHIGGNCHTSRDEETGIMVHRYGPHIFHTDDKEIWNYVNRFSTFRPYVHKVKGVHNGKAYTLPVNLDTIREYFGADLNSEEAEIYLRNLSDKTIVDPENFEEQALSFIGAELYHAFFYGYTKKQWGCEPKELPASVLKRIPVRFNHDNAWHPSKYSGIPEDGYTAVMQKMIEHPSISLSLNTTFEADLVESFDHVFYTGAIDRYFGNKHGRLGYRTVTFEKFVEEGDHQGITQVNYCDENIPYTRVTEHKHFTPWETHANTVYFKEYSKETAAGDDPFYPKRLTKDKEIFDKYRSEAHSQNRISFLGRLATYRYMDMHQVIGEALKFSEKVAEAYITKNQIPVFPNE